MNQWPQMECICMNIEQEEPDLENHYRVRLMDGMNLLCAVKNRKSLHLTITSHLVFFLCVRLLICTTVATTGLSQSKVSKGFVKDNHSDVPGWVNAGLADELTGND